MDAARRWGKTREIFPFKSFEEAADALKQGCLDAILVPGAYPKINAFIMDSELRAVKVFIQKIPALVSACKGSVTATAFNNIFHHSAVTPLLEELDCSWEKSTVASSNSEACRMHLTSSNSSSCITNALCAAHFELSILQVLRGGISMPWICFGKGSFFEQDIV